MIFIKKYIIFTISLLITIIILLLPEDIITKDGEIRYELINENETNYIYFINEEKVVGYPVDDLEQDKFKLITETFKILTEKSNSVSPDYYTYLNLNTKLLSYEIRGNDIYLEVSDNFFLIEENNVIFALAQILYSYKELGYEEVYIVNNGQVIPQIADVVTIDGLTELPVNLEINSSGFERKNIKINYYFKNGTKLFINHIVGKDEDEVKYKVDKIINFVNKEYNIDVELVKVEKLNDRIIISVSCSDKNVDTLKNIIMKNLKVKSNDIIIT